MLLLIPFACSCGYQLLATWLAWRFSSRRLAGHGVQAESVSEGGAAQATFCQVKPMQEPWKETLRAVESFLGQRGAGVAPHDVFLCSAFARPDDWLARHPEVTWLRLDADSRQNGKAATLALAEPFLSGEVFVISDADMWAAEDYLAQVMAPFDDPQVGVVTCLYRSTSPSWDKKDLCHLFEALCILDFSTSVLVAEKTEGISFAMGSTMAIRREALSDIGGFRALTPYLADDYQLGNRAHNKGWKVRLASTILETDPPRGRLRAALSHQYRWLVTSRVSRPGGHAAFVLTQGLLWSLCLVLSNPKAGCQALGAWMVLRVVCGFLAQWSLGARKWSGVWPAVALPWKDVLYLGLWFGSLWGRTVLWGARRLVIDSKGRIVA